MKIAIAIQEKNLTTNINKTFARAPYFVIYNSENKDVQFIDNEAKESSGGAGIQASQNLVDKDVEAIISLSLGINAQKVLSKSNVKMFFAREDKNIQQNIDMLLAGELNTLVDIHNGYHNK